MKIEDIITSERTAADIITALKQKSLNLPAWAGVKGLKKQYDPSEHPVMNKAIYPDIVTDNGIERVTRITYDLQRLAVKRMTELMTGMPVKRIYKPKTEMQQDIARWLEAIFTRNRIDTVNIDRCNMLFASCEVMTLWYAVEQRNNLYGFDSPLKFKCVNFSPMTGDELYPLFDEYGDMIAMSIAYRRKSGRTYVSYFDTYTEDHHYKWSTAFSDEWTLVEDEDIRLGKIPGIYMYRPTPIWEDTSKIVYEMEWAMSRNGNYLRRNSKPLFVVFANEEIAYGEEKSENREFRSILQYPQGSSAQYVTWQQAVDNLRFYIAELRQSFFTQLQLPDWSYESMKATPMSGESRKQLFIDAQLKVRDESGRFLEFLDREVNVVKAFLKAVTTENYHADIDSLEVEVEVTPFTISSERDTIEQLLLANGNKPLMSEKESIEYLGWSTDVDRTMTEIRDESATDVFAM